MKGSRMGERIKRIAKKTGKGFLWLIKLGFVVLCLLIWGALCVPLGESILPAFYDQCVYHEFAEEFLREKYGEHINVHNQRLPLYEVNIGNSHDYRYTFRLRGKTYLFPYYARNWSEDGDFYGDNVMLYISLWIVQLIKLYITVQFLVLNELAGDFPKKFILIQ